MSAQVAQASPIVHGLLPREQHVLKVLLYFDIFDYPLTAEEILSFLPSPGLSINGLVELLRSGSLRGIVHSRGRFFFLGSASDSCIENRLSKERFALRRLRIASLVGRFIGLFPFVQAVMLSGELSKGIASRNSDIDFAVVTRTRRLWICRTILILFKKVFLLDNKKYFCLNHFVSEEDLSVETRNIYSATEIATLKPLCNNEQYARYLRANQWIRDFFPNWKPAVVGGLAVGDPVNGRERCDSGSSIERFLDRVDLWLMVRWRQLWQRRYADLSNEERQHKFRCETSISTAYGEDYQQRILEQYSLRLRKYGVSGPERRN